MTEANAPARVYAPLAGALRQAGRQAAAPSWLVVPRPLPSAGYPRGVTEGTPQSVPAGGRQYRDLESAFEAHKNVSSARALKGTRTLKPAEHQVSSIGAVLELTSLQWALLWPWLLHREHFDEDQWRSIEPLVSLEFSCNRSGEL